MADGGESAFHSPTHSQSSEKLQTAFRKLLSDLSERLRPEEVKRISFLCNLPEERSSKALDTLKYLMEVGTFSHENVKPLSDILKNVNRHDLVNDFVTPYAHAEEQWDGEFNTLRFHSYYYTLCQIMSV